MTQSILTRFDALIGNESAAAIVMRQYLKPVEGDMAVIFPPTYANIGYNIDPVIGSEEIKNVCTIDSVGSQANRMEPIFKRKPYSALVPQIFVEVRKPASKGQDKGDLIDTIHLLDAGHRIADAVVRFSGGADEITKAFQCIREDATPLAKLSPTSLVFGCWDSRASSVKLPRIVRSTILAYNVHELKRSAQYTPATERYDETFDKLGEKEKKKFADVGMNHVPSTGAPGGVLLDSKSLVVKDTVISLTALRALRSKDEERTKTLHRYVFGLVLVAVTAQQEPLLRMGCELICDPERPSHQDVVWCDGEREAFELQHKAALEFALAAAESFGIGESKTFLFNPKVAMEELKKLTSKGKKGEEEAT